MTLALSRRMRATGLSGLLLALVALAMQIAAASVVPFAAPAASVDRLVAASICHTDTTDHGGAPVRQHAPDCAVCPFCHAIAHAGVLLASPMAAFIGPAVLVARAFAWPASRAPPGRAGSAASARGPPATL
jgi:Protein of unknown function (DUF2946)